MSDLKTRIIEKVSRGELTKEFAFELIKALQKGPTPSDLAVIGIAGRFPGARSVEEFWSNLRDGVCSIGAFPQNRRKDVERPTVGANTEADPYLRGGYLEEIDRLDAEFFRLSPKEAQLMDPYQRVFLETAWEAIEDAGYAGGQWKGTKTGIYVGRDFSDGSFYKEIMSEPNPLAVTGLATSILASRIAYILNLQGPAMVIDTACSSSLVALHLACQAIRGGEIDSAIVGGIALSPNPIAVVGTGVDSPDATVRAFDKGANGTVWGEGAGVVLIKPLEKAIQDGDRIYILIKGSAINNDGTSNGLVAPKAETQTEVILRAWEEAKVHPESLTYIECHGTGTQLGDPIEMKGLTDAFKQYTRKKQFCYIGSLKPNIGHLVGASGIASVIKVILAMQHGQIPASLHFTEPNPLIDFIDSPFAVNTQLTPWEVEGGPRRAGITSLGFSGTNCHVIFEEYHRPEFTPLAQSPEQAEILTLTANSETALLQLVRDYQQYLHESSVNTLGDLCYTANIGRSQHRYRLALVVETMAELREKISRLTRGDFAAIAQIEPGIYYGSHRLVGYKDRADGDELLETERIRLSEIAAQKIPELSRLTGAERVCCLGGLAEVYVKGAEFSWADLYNQSLYQKIKVPGYPFERKRFWLKPQIKPEANSSNAAERLMARVESSLFDQYLEMAGQDLYLTGFSLAQHWVLREHRIMGLYIIPGTTYLEMFLQIVEPFRMGRVIEVENLTFVTPLVVQEQEVKVVQTLVKNEGESIECTIMSKTDLEGVPENQRWLRHAIGKLRFTPNVTPERKNLDAIIRRCPEERTIPIEHYMIPGVYEMGPRWRNIRQVYVGANEVLGYLELDHTFEADLQQFLNHPAMMDMAVGVASQLVENSREYLPFSYKKIRIYTNLPMQFYSYAVKKESLTEKRETITFDIIIMDVHGNIVLTIDEYMIKKVNKAEVAVRTREPFYYTTHWVPEICKTGDPHHSDGQILLLKGETDLNDTLTGELQAAGQRVIQVSIGEMYAKTGIDQYCVGDSEEDYQRLLADISQEKPIEKIIHLATARRPEVGSEADLRTAEQYGVWSVFHLTKAFQQHRLHNPCELVLISDYVHEVTGTEERIQPEQASLFALGNVAGQEYPKLTVRCIDIDDAATAGTIYPELIAANPAPRVAYRNGIRYVQEMSKADLAQIADRPVEWKQAGVYLITGGLGGLGLEIGKWLARKCPVKLALVNRTPMPARNQWGEILTRNEDTRLVTRIKAIQEMETHGTEVTCYAANVACLSEMEKVITDLRSRYGKINGVIHAAGLAGEGLLANKSRTVFESVLAPKVQGTWILDQLTVKDELDFFILFSSLNAIFGGPGQSDYAAANAYLDAYAAYRRKKRGHPTISMNWPAWRDTGMAVQYGVHLDGGVFKAIGLTAGMDALGEVVKKDRAQILVGEINYDTLLHLPDRLPIRFDREITATLERKKRRSGQTGAKSNQPITDVTIKEDSGQLSDTERKVAAIWASALGYEEVSIYDNFYDVGGDSIIAITMGANLSAAFQIDFPLEEIFNHPTIDGISKMIPNLTTTVRFKKVERRRIQL